MQLKSAKYPLYLGLLSIFSLSSFSIAEDQTEIMSYCGSNSVYALLKLNKIDVNLEDITELPIVKEKTDGLSLLDLKNIVNSYGLDLECVKVGIDELEFFQKPFIAHISRKYEGHFLVCWPTDEGMHIIDYPEAVLLKWELFEQAFTDFTFTGHALVDRNSKRIKRRNNSQKKQVSAVNSFDDPKFSWLSDNILDCGMIGKNKIAEEYYTFKFSNIGNKTLVISDLRSSCSCLEAKIERQRLKPGEESYIRIKIDRDKNGPFEYYCYFRTNDTSMTIGKASVKGTIFSPVRTELLPNKCEFGKVTPQKRYSKKIKILNTVGVDQTAIDIKAISNTLQNQISTKLDDEWKEKRYGHINLREIILTINLLPETLPGDYSDEVVMTFDKGQLSIPVSFSVKPFVEAYPSVCVFNFPRDNTDRRIAIKTDRDRGFTIESIKADASWIKVHCTETITDVSNYRELTVEIIDKEHEFSKGAIELSGKSGNQNWTINIPVICIRKQDAPYIVVCY